MTDEMSESTSSGLAVAHDGADALEGFFQDVKTSIQAWFDCGPTD